MKIEEFVSRLSLEYALKNRRKSRIDLLADSGEKTAQVMITFEDGKKGLFDAPLREVWGEISPEVDMVERHHKKLLSAQETQERLLEWAASRLFKGHKRGKKKPSLSVAQTPLASNS